ncbi:MAG: M15 family metallopeptidase [Bacteroidia bacterium]
MKKYIVLTISLVAIFACNQQTKEPHASPAFVKKDAGTANNAIADNAAPAASDSATVSDIPTAPNNGGQRKVKEPELIADAGIKSDELNVRDMEATKGAGSKTSPAKTSPAKPSAIIATKKSAEVTKEYLLGKFDYKMHPDFTKIEGKYASKADMYLRKEAYAAFQQMYDAAQKAGVNLRIISATRNFNEQKAIWERKWTGDYAKYEEGAARATAILSFSSMPSTSRHHWGTDMDLNDLNDAYFQKGEGKKIYEWLTANAATYGFCNVYSPKTSGRTGYNEEKWHWSYTPLASSFTQQYAQKVSYADITGFKGEESAKKIEVIKNYVQGINTVCK